MRIRTSIKAGANATNHGPTVRIRTSVKAGAPVGATNRAVTVRARPAACP